MPSEKYKQEAFDILEKMNDDELEEVLLKIGSIRQWRNNSEDNTPKRRQMKTFDNFIPCFNEIMNRGNGKFTIIKKMNVGSNKNYTRVAYHATVENPNTHNVVDTVEYHTDGVDSDMVGITRRYTFDEFTREIFDKDFLYNGTMLELHGGGIVYYGGIDFIQSIKEAVIKSVLISGLALNGYTMAK